MLAGLLAASLTAGPAAAQARDDVAAPALSAPPDLISRADKGGAHESTAALDSLARTVTDRARADALAQDVLGLVAAGEARIGEADADAVAAIPFEEALAMARAALEIDPETGLRADRATPKITVFLSLGLPEAMIAQYLDDAVRFDAALVIRGLVDDDLTRTLAVMNGLLETHSKRTAGPNTGSQANRDNQHGVGIAIDPRAFEMFEVEQVPAIVLTETAYEHCDALGCPPPPRFDKVSGSVSVEAALALMADQGDLAEAAAARLAPDARQTAGRGGQ